VTEDATIDPLSPVSRHVQLAGILRGQIERGELAPGDPIPSQTQLVQQHGLARMTVQRAVRILVAEGLVVIVPGIGGFVRKP
jgi:GntR family transcriptional regulator